MQSARFVSSHTDFFQCLASRLGAQYETENGIDNVQADKDEEVSPLYTLKRGRRDL